jgi:hypothetical protein
LPTSLPALTLADAARYLTCVSLFLSLACRRCHRQASRYRRWRSLRWATTLSSFSLSSILSLVLLAFSCIEEFCLLPVVVNIIVDKMMLMLLWLVAVPVPVPTLCRCNRRSSITISQARRAVTRTFTWILDARRCGTTFDPRPEVSGPPSYHPLLLIWRRTKTGCAFRIKPPRSLRPY